MVAIILWLMSCLNVSIKKTLVFVSSVASVEKNFQHTDYLLVRLTVRNSWLDETFIK